MKFCIKYFEEAILKYFTYNLYGVRSIKNVNVNSYFKHYQRKENFT